ncbi:hypothetical protein Btru_026278 [Bulinus truncatus]|nr:hypothetical protein Btru_026278 [Bulinus truncatus]
MISFFKKYSDMEKTLQTGKLLLLFILHFLSTAESFPNGAPSSACLTLFPQHDNALSQSAALPYDITLEPKQFQPSDTITVTIADPQGVSSLKGLVIAAFKKSHPLENIVGQFIQFPTDKLQPLNCTSGTQKNVLTHRNSDNVWSIRLTWRAPDEYIGDVLFRVTLVKDFLTFWHDVHLLLVAEERIDNTEPHAQTSEMAVMVQTIDFSACGHSKGCFLYPSYCSGDNCLSAMTYSLRNGSRDFLIELMCDSQQNYISMGLSKDTVMGGGDETFTCVYDGFNSSNIQQGYNPGHYNVPDLKKHILGQEIRYDNGRLECRFYIPVNSSAEDDEIKYSYINTDSRYVQLAWGSVLPKSFVILKHDNMPAQSESKVDFREYAVHIGSAFPGLVRVHAVFMIVVWVFVCGVTTAISRHFKEFLPHIEVAGTKIWFQVKAFLYRIS